MFKLIILMTKSPMMNAACRRSQRLMPCDLSLDKNISGNTRLLKFVEDSLARTIKEKDLDDAVRIGDFHLFHAEVHPDSLNRRCHRPNGGPVQEKGILLRNAWGRTRTWHDISLKLAPQMKTVARARAGFL